MIPFPVEPDDPRPAALHLFAALKRGDPLLRVPRSRA